MKHDVCFASFKYPSLSRGGVKRPDDILYPGALTERHEKAQQCYQARMFRHFFLFTFTWTCSWQCSMGLPSFCRGQAGTWPAEGNNIRNLALLYQETKQQNRHDSDVKVHLSVQLKRLQFTSSSAVQKVDAFEFMFTSMGSTSLAITTSWAFFFSMRVVTYQNKHCDLNRPTCKQRECIKIGL